jgi:hypothetical protein
MEPAFQTSDIFLDPDSGQCPKKIFLDPAFIVPKINGPLTVKQLVNRLNLFQILSF